MRSQALALQARTGLDFPNLAGALEGRRAPGPHALAARALSGRLPFHGAASAPIVEG